MRSLRTFHERVVQRRREEDVLVKARGEFGAAGIIHRCELVAEGGRGAGGSEEYRGECVLGDLARGGKMGEVRKEEKAEQTSAVGCFVSKLRFLCISNGV